MSEENYIIQARGLNKIYKRKEGPIKALANFSLDVEKGEILGLLGPNGAGKTTAVKIIMGFIAPSAGEVIFKDRPMTVATPRPEFGYLPESFRPNPNLTVAEYITLQGRLASGGKRNHGPTTTELLELVGMERFPRRKISDLSKGMGQRVGLAQAFAGNPDVLILDEPSSGLDPIGRNEVIQVLLEMKNRGKTIFFCSHILAEVDRLCDRIGVIVEGRLRFLGPAIDFKNKWDAVDLEDAFIREVKCETS